MSSVTAGKAIKISRDIANAISYLHSYDIVHRDIKVQNILMDDNEEVYLADFGTCQCGTENSTIVGTYPLPPEITDLKELTSSSSSSKWQHSYEGKATDVDLLGRLMFACSPKDRYVPESETIIEDVRQLDRNKVPESYCQLIVHCLQKDAEKRPTSKDIVHELDGMTGRLCARILTAGGSKWSV